MSAASTAAISHLRACGVHLEPGLTTPELEAAEARFGFRFSDDHRDFLHAALPIGERWPNWRALDDRWLIEAVDWPVRGVLFDVGHDQFWPPSWGIRPRDERERVARARAELRLWPRLVPLFAHRCIPAAPWNGPVFSAYQTDVIIHGDDLHDWATLDFGPKQEPGSTRYAADSLPPWSLLAFGEDVP